MSIRIGSFNLQDFNLKSDNESKKDFEKIAEIIISEKFDIIAIQEVLSERAIKYLTEKLNKTKTFYQNWIFACDFPINRNVNKSEGYAFIWNDKKINLLEIENKENPRIIKDFEIKNVPGQTSLIRNPYFGRFVPKNRAFEIRLINTHIKSQKGDLDKAVCTASQNQMRLNEFDLLAKTILTKCTDYVPLVATRTAYTFLLGDYNINLSANRYLCNLGEAYLKDNVVQAVERNGRIRNVITIQEELSTLKVINEGEEQPTYIYSNNFDHFSYDDAKTGHVVQSKAERIEAVNKYLDNKLSDYRKKISDHVPIALNVNA